MKVKTNNNEIWARLMRGESLKSFGVGLIDGRIDLSGLRVPSSGTSREFKFESTSLAEIEPTTVEGVELADLDFTGSKLRGLRIRNCRFTNCRFVECDARDWRIWASDFRQCSFRAANLNGSALGSVIGPTTCRYTDVDFSAADLRNTTYVAAAFKSCDFRHAKLERIDFQSSTFEDCVFEGELHDVLFYSESSGGGAYPKNEMLNVDFRKAQLHHVDFRGLTLERVSFPQDENHVVITDVHSTIERLSSVLNSTGDATDKRIAAFLNIGGKRVVPGQKQKAINKEDLAQVVGKAGVRRLEQLLDAGAE